ncbi:ENTH-domain-containing protein [Rickenella mellea]|uniref:ENTH-domain-containing protein n=1 Tax=Rickenella mellea TaxID=50990 RepID=A0A4Y7QBD4_9AGAM|nr:ENTH-domain-containing protein [Rickenella mellea]
MSIWHISAAQSKVREATSNDLPLPSGKQMNELAQMSYHQPDFVEIMEVLDMRLNEKGKNWKQLYKALVVLDYLLHWGSENVVAYFKDNIHVIKNLREFQHVDDRNDGGIIVRHKAKDVTNLLEDEELLRNVRMNHASMHDRPMSGDPTNGSDLERRSTTPAYSDSSHTSSKRPLHVPPNSEESSEASHISDPAHDISLSQGNLSAAKARFNKSTRPQSTLVSSTGYGPSNAPTRPSLSAVSGGERSFPLYPASVRSYLENSQST